MRTVVYARTSTLDQASDDKVSIPDQIKWAKQITEEWNLSQDLNKEWKFVGEYIDPGVRGYEELEKRNGVKKLLKDSHDDMFDVVLCYHTSRVAREQDLLQKFGRLLGNDKVQVFFRNIPIKPVKKEDYYWGGNYMFQTMTSAAGIGDQQENVARGERVRSGFRGIAEKGKLVFAPFGYKKIYSIDKEGKRTWSWEIDQVKASIVEEMFYSYGNKNATIRGIMAKLNQDKVPTPTGSIVHLNDEKKIVGGWNTGTIKNILNNPAYKGFVRWGRKLGSRYKQGESQGGKQKRVINTPDKWILVKGYHPAIVSEALFDKVQKRLQERGRITGRVIASPGLLTGLVRCGVCGKNAYHKVRHIKIKSKSGTKTSIRSDYICSTYISKGKEFCRRHIMSAPKLNDLVIDDIGKTFNDMLKTDGIFYVGDKTKPSTISQNKKQLTKELENLEKESQRLLKAYTKGKITLKMFGDEKDQIDKSSKIISDKLSKIEEIYSQKDLLEKAKKRFMSLAKEFKKKFKSGSFSSQKELLHALIDSVIVSRNGKIKINYKID